MLPFYREHQFSKTHNHIRWDTNSNTQSEKAQSNFRQIGVKTQYKSKNIEISDTSLCDFMQI